ncbi:protein kinase, partial [Acidobacteriota bacterium]
MVGKTLKHYQVEELLGKGGMGEVYRALDTKLKRPVAIKVLREELTSDEERRKRFLQEARAAAAVVHPAIAQVYDVDEVDDLTFIVMEFVQGETVSQLIVKKELDLLGSIEIALQVSEGLSQAHKSNIIHRDIKSDNIMVTRTGHAKVLDFGLAKLLETQESGATPESTLDFHRTATMAKTIAGTVMGTIAYMSPEQARGQDIAQPSDVFSLGIVLYEMVTGELPFTGESPLDTMHSIAFEEAKPVTVIRKNLPPHLQRIISKCLRKKAEDRYPDAHALALDLKQLKHEIDSGIQRPLAPLDHVQNIMDWAKSSITSSTQLIVLAIFVIAAVTLIFVFAIPWAQLLWIGITGFFVYRYVRNRKNRMIKK